MNKKVLIVDDSQTMRQLESHYLKQLGFQVIEASDGLTALEKLSNDCTLLISDLNMPGMNGLELISRIRDNSCNKNIPAIVISTESSVDFQAQAKKAGVSAWLQKPFTAASLSMVITKLLPEGDG